MYGKSSIFLQLLVNMFFLMSSAIGVYSYYSDNTVLFYICAVLILAETLFDIFVNRANPGTLYIAVMIGLGGTLYHMFAKDAGISIAFSNIGIVLLFISGIIYLLTAVICIINLFARR